MKDPTKRLANLFMTPQSPQEHVLLGTVAQTEPLVISVSGVGERDADAFVMDAHIFSKGELVVLYSISDTGASGAQWILQPLRQGGYIGRRTVSGWSVSGQSFEAADVFDELSCVPGDHVLLIPTRNTNERWTVVTKWRT